MNDLGSTARERPESSQDLKKRQDCGSKGLAGWVRVWFRHDALGWWVWGCFGLFIVLSKVSSPQWSGDICGIYFRAGADLLSGRPLYEEPREGGDFLYLPPAAFFLVPFSWGPFPLMASLWRLINLAVFSAGVFGLTRMKRTDGRSVSFALVSAIVCLLSISASRHGQMTLTIAGLLMLAASNVERSRLWTASFLIVLSMALKPIGLPFLMLAAVVHKSVIWRMLPFAVILVSLPFVAQPHNFGYVLDQYRDVPGMLRQRVERREGATEKARERTDKANPHIFGFLDVVGVRVGNSGRFAALALFAAGALVAYLVGRPRLQQEADRSLLLYGISVGYILIFSPTTERNTYALLAPVTGILWCLAGGRENRGVQVALALAVGSSLASHSLQKLLPGVGLTYIMKVFGAIVVMFILLGVPFGILRRSTEGAKTVA